MTLQAIYEIVWTIVMFMASLWAGTKAFHRDDSRRMRLISAAACIALALLFLWHLFKVVTG